MAYGLRHPPPPGMARLILALRSCSLVLSFPRLAAHLSLLRIICARVTNEKQILLHQRPRQHHHRDERAEEVEEALAGIADRARLAFYERHAAQPRRHLSHI